MYHLHRAVLFLFVFNQVQTQQKFLRFLIPTIFVPWNPHSQNLNQIKAKGKRFFVKKFLVDIKTKDRFHISTSIIIKTKELCNLPHIIYKHNILFSQYFSSEITKFTVVLLYLHGMSTTVARSGLKICERNSYCTVKLHGLTTSLLLE